MGEKRSVCPEPRSYSAGSFARSLARSLFLLFPSSSAVVASSLLVSRLLFRSYTRIIGGSATVAMVAVWPSIRSFIGPLTLSFVPSSPFILIVVGPFIPCIRFAYKFVRSLVERGIRRRWLAFATVAAQQRPIGDRISGMIHLIGNGSSLSSYR